MQITTLQALRTIYKPASERALKKEIPELDAHALQFIGLSPFVVLASGGATADLDADLDVRDRHGTRRAQDEREGSDDEFH